MFLGIMHTALGGKDLKESFARAKQVGAGGVELTYVNEKDALLLSDPAHARAVVALSRSYGVKTPSICLGFLCLRRSLIDRRHIAASQEHIARAIRFARRIKARTVLVPFQGKNNIEIEDELNWAAEALAEPAAIAEQAGVVLGLESNLNTSQMRFLLGGVGNSPSVKIYYDTGNALARKFDIATGIRDLHDGIAQVHLRDVRVGGGAPPDFNVALGEGHVDFRAAVLALEAIGFDGWAILETPATRDPLAGARANLNFVRKILGARAAA